MNSPWDIDVEDDGSGDVYVAVVDQTNNRIILYEDAEATSIGGTIPPVYSTSFGAEANILGFYAQAEAVDLVDNGTVFDIYVADGARNKVVKYEAAPVPTITLVFTAVMFMMSMPTKSEAMPFFARQFAKNCTYCHTSFPKLNENGRVFRSNGYRFSENAGSGEWKDVKSWKIMPLGVEVEVEGEYTSKTDNSVAGATTKTKETDLKVEEAEFMAGGSMGPNGEVSAMAVIAVEQHGDGSYEVGMGPAYVQLNDVLGPVGEGRMNFRAGQWAIALPFMGADQQILHNGYLAEEIGVFTAEERNFELNGSGVAEEDSAMPTYRYAFGVTRTDTTVEATDPDITLDAESDKMVGEYGSFALTFQENFNIGVLYRHTEVAYEDVQDEHASLRDEEKLGVAAEYSFKKGGITLGMFKSDGKDFTVAGVNQKVSDLNNTVVELILYPTKKIVLGARYDVLEDTKAEGLEADGMTRNGKPGSADDVEYLTVTARYNVLPNVYAQLEWRDHSDTDKVINSDTDIEKGRLFLVALY